MNSEIQCQFNETAQQHNAVLAFAMLDVDYFKNYNDYYGHLKGDEILQKLVLLILIEITLTHDIHELMKAADLQLYLAKNVGRDQLRR